MQPGVINGEDMTRVRAVEAWLDKGGPPPQSWEVKAKADVSIGKELARGRSKCVRHGRLGTRKVVVVAVCPVSNSSAFAGHNYKELHAAGEALTRRHHLVEEMYFFEALRGRPGIPTLRGAFLENGDLSIVVDDCGARITRVDHHKKQPIASDAWRGFAKRDPLGAALRARHCPSGPPPRAAPAIFAPCRARCAHPSHPFLTPRRKTKQEQ